MFFITKSVTWLIIGFLIVRPALFDSAISVSAKDIGRNAAHSAVTAQQIAQTGITAHKNNANLGNEVTKFCLDRAELCTQTGSVIGGLILGSIVPVQKKAHIKKQEFVSTNLDNNKEPFVPMPRMRPDYL